MTKFFFKDTTFIFRLVYFITAMIPSLLIFIISNFSLMKPYILNFKKSWFFIAIILIGIFLVIKYMHKFMNQSQNCTIEITYIIDVNDKTISLLTGIILPTVVSTTDNLCVNLLTYFGMLFVIYKLMMRSSNSFPNLILILFGYDLYKCEGIETVGDIPKSKDNIFILSKKDLQDGKKGPVNRIANSGIYIWKEK